MSFPTKPKDACLPLPLPSVLVLAVMRHFHTLWSMALKQSFTNLLLPGPLLPAQFQAVHPAAQQPVIAQFPVVSQGSSQQQLIQNFYQQQQQQQQQLATALHQQQLLTQQAALQQKAAVAAVPQPQAQPAAAAPPAPAQEPAVRVSQKRSPQWGLGRGWARGGSSWWGGCWTKAWLLPNPGG